MRILLDESVPVQLRRDFVGHDARTVRYMGWLGIDNGDLLKLARDRFDVFVTSDQNMPHQWNITSRDLPIIIFKGKSNARKDLAPLVPKALTMLDDLKRGEIRTIESE